jgi:hypothetical protein
VGDSVKTDFTMGTDPEIVFVDTQGRLLSAEDYLPRAQTHNGDGRLDPNEFGCDGHPWIAELRPPPGGPEELTAHLERIMRNNISKLPPGCIWHAGGFVMGKPLGGHIHYSLPPIESLVTALDGVLTQLLSAIENDDESRRRRAGQYGKLGDVRPQPHGFEYRTPSSFIKSRSITLGIFALAKAIAYEELCRGKKRVQALRGAEAELIKVDTDRYLAADRAYFYTKLQPLYALIRSYQFWKTPEGRKLWRYTRGLATIAQYSNGWDNGQGILQRWKIVARRPQTAAAAEQTVVTIPAGQLLTDRDLWAMLEQIPLRVQTARAEPVHANTATGDWAMPRTL